MNHSFYFPSAGLANEKAVFLAIDDMMLPLKKNLCYYMSKPQVRSQPVIAPSEDPKAPDHIATHFYGTVLYDEGKYRIWYYAVNRADEDAAVVTAGLREGPICYAESDDGILWLKPKLGQVFFKGSWENNALAVSDRLTEGAFVIKDMDDPDPLRRYKMVFEERPREKGKDKKNCYSVSMAVSQDGLHWAISQDQPIDEGLEPCSFYKFNNLYIINAQFAPLGVSEGGHAAGRQGHAWISPDFNDWLQESAASFTLPEASDPVCRGLDKSYLQVHLGAAPFSYGNVMVGLYCRWNAQPQLNDWFGRGTTSGDLGIVTSNDGMHFHEPVKGHVFLSGKDDPVTPYPGKALPTILCQANGILNVGNETRIYHGRWRNGDSENDEYYGEIGLATLPRDRWGALGLYPGKETGSVWSAPIRLPEDGCKLFLNADGADMMQIEVSDEHFKFMKRYSGENSGMAEGNGLDCPVSFPQGDLREFGGQTVRLRVHMKNSASIEPRLYAITLVTTS